MDRYTRLNAVVAGLVLCSIGWCAVYAMDDAALVCAGLVSLIVAHFIIGYVSGGR